MLRKGGKLSNYRRSQHRTRLRPERSATTQLNSNFSSTSATEARDSQRQLRNKSLSLAWHTNATLSLAAPHRGLRGFKDTMPAPASWSVRRSTADTMARSCGELFTRRLAMFNGSRCMYANACPAPVNFSMKASYGTTHPDFLMSQSTSTFSCAQSHPMRDENSKPSTVSASGLRVSDTQSSAPSSSERDSKMSTSMATDRSTQSNNVTLDRTTSVDVPVTNQNPSLPNTPRACAENKAARVRETLPLLTPPIVENEQHLINDVLRLITSFETVPERHLVARSFESKPSVVSVGNVTTINAADPCVLPLSVEEEMLRTQLAALLSRLINHDVALGQRVVQSFDEDSRRLFLVLATASEYFGKQSASVEAVKADADMDARISSEEYDAWLHSAARRRERIQSALQPLPTGSQVLELPKAIPKTVKAAPEMSKTVVPGPKAARITLSTRQWLAVALYSGAPFIAFGFLDNAVLCMSGGLIDSYMSDHFGFSSLTAAALGGIVSGTLGVQVHGLTERAVHSHLAPPRLTEEQEDSSAFQSACHWGNVLCLVTGLIFGMVPLLWMNPSVAH